jgi:rifampicin phosphotransferase
MPTHIVRFDEVQARDHGLVGGKGANLARMVAAGLPVPGGFTVTTDAYTEFMTTTGVDERITRLVKEVDFSDAAALEVASAEIRQQIEREPLPAKIAKSLRTAYLGLGDSPSVAVRSSGVAEDLADASFAGLHDTYLDITGADEVADAVRRCWASLWTARAAAYRDVNRFEHSVGIAVVVQTMVRSQVAGVLFTANPLTTATDEMVVNAAWGLGEAVVSGLTTPDEFILDSGDLHVKQRTLGEKDKRVVRDPASGQGTVIEEVEPENRMRFSLSDADLATLGGLGRKVQDYYGRLPQDIEWCFADGAFCLVQARPATGAAFSWDADVDDWQWMPKEPDDEVWTRARADEVWNGAVTPLFYDIRARAFTRANENLNTVLGNHDLAKLRMFKYYKGKPYYNCRLEAEFIGRFLPGARSDYLSYVPEAWRQDVLEAPFSYATYLRMHVRCRFLAKDFGVTNWWKTMDFYLSSVEEADGLSDEQLRNLSDRELRRYAMDRVDYEAQYIIDAWSGFHFHGQQAMGMLRLLIRRWYDGPNTMAFIDLITGTPRPTATLIETYEQWTLAQGIKKSPELLTIFEKSDASDFLENFANCDDGIKWLSGYKEFVQRNGHRGHADRDIYFLRRTENPAAVDYRALLTFVSSDAEDPKFKEEAAEAYRIEVREEVAANLRKKSFGWLREDVFRTLMDYVMKFLIVRDDQRHWVDRSTFTIKRTFLELSRRLRARGLLENDRDFYFLTINELFQVMDGSASEALTRAKIVSRMRNFDVIHDDHVETPMYIRRYASADAEFDRSTVHDQPGVLRGNGTSRGVRVGRARVIKRLEDIHTVRDGEILVVNSTDPGWTPVFLVIAGIVHETGGMLAHASCLAREYGMPAVHLPKAMNLIPDGALVRIDGEAGTIELQVQANAG